MRLPGPYVNPLPPWKLDGARSERRSHVRHYRFSGRIGHPMVRLASAGVLTFFCGESGPPIVFQAIIFATDVALTIKAVQQSRQKSINGALQNV